MWMTACFWSSLLHFFYAGSLKKKKKPTSDYLLRLSYNCSTRYLRQKYSNFTFTQIYDSVGLGWDLRIYLSNNFPDDANVPSLRILLWHV